MDVDYAERNCCYLCRLNNPCHFHCDRPINTKALDTFHQKVMQALLEMPGLDDRARDELPARLIPIYQDLFYHVARDEPPSKYLTQRLQVLYVAHRDGRFNIDDVILDMVHHDEIQKQHLSDRLHYKFADVEEKGREDADFASINECTLGCRRGIMCGVHQPDYPEIHRCSHCSRGKPCRSHCCKCQDRVPCYVHFSHY